MIGFVVEPYGEDHRALLRRSHYLCEPPPGCIFAVAVRTQIPGLFGPTPHGQLRGVCLVGRPAARILPQDGSVGEVTRLVLDGCPHGTASALLRYVFDEARRRGMTRIISYHDRARHTGCIYRKAGMKKDRKTLPPTGAGWASRAGRRTDAQSTPKQRWTIDLTGAHDNR